MKGNIEVMLIGFMLIFIGLSLLNLKELIPRYAYTSFLDLAIAIFILVSIVAMIFKAD